MNDTHRLLRVVARALFAVSLMAAGHAPGALAQVAVRDIAVSDDDRPVAVLTDWGVLLPGAEGQPPSLSCASRYGPADWLLFTGLDGLLLAGEGGPWTSSELGCHWRRTTGAADERRVVGLHQPATATDTVLFAIDDPGGSLSAVVMTSDGGLTTTLAGGLSIGESVLTGMAGQGDAVEVTGLDPAGHILRWRSDDAGGTFVAAPVDDAELGPTATPAALGGDTLWLWDDGTLHGVDRSSGDVTADRSFAADFRAVSDLEGRLYVAAGVDGLWRRALSGDWEQLHTDATTTVSWVAGFVWVGREATAEGDPMVLASSDGGETWTTLLTVPGTWRYPVGCESSYAQLCHDEAVDLANALSIEPPSDPGAVAAPTEPGADGPADAGGCDGSARTNPGGAPAWALILLALALLTSGRRRHGSP